MPKSGGRWHHDFTVENVMVGLISAMLGCAGPAIMVLEGARAAQLTEAQFTSWIFAIYFFGGLYSIVMPLMLKMPVTGAHSITGVAFVVTVMAYYSFSEFVGAYLLSGVLIFLFGITGIFNKFIELVPREIIGAMLAGMMLRYVIELIPALLELPWIGAMAVVGFILMPRLFRKVPAIFGALVFGIFGLILFHPISLPSDMQFIAPQMQTPTFSLASFLSVSLPLAVLIMSNDLAQGIGALKNYGYHPPVSKIIATSGIASICAGLFGGHCSNIGGMMTALCADPSVGPMNKRYMASVVSGFGLLLFGLFSWYMVKLLAVLPPDFIKIIAGFAISGILLSSLQIGFSSEKYRFSVLFTFVIAASNIHVLNVSSPVWALLVGSLLAKWLGEGEKRHSKKLQTSEHHMNTNTGDAVK